MFLNTVLLIGVLTLASFGVSYASGGNDFPSPETRSGNTWVDPDGNKSDVGIYQRPQPRPRTEILRKSSSIVKKTSISDAGEPQPKNAKANKLSDRGISPQRPVRVKAKTDLPAKTSRKAKLKDADISVEERTIPVKAKAHKAIVVTEAPAPVAAEKVESRKSVPEDQSPLTNSVDQPHEDKIALLNQPKAKVAASTEESGFTIGSLLSTLLKLALVLGLAYVTILALKHLSGNRMPVAQNTHDLKIVETVKLSQNSAVHIINARGKSLLIGCTSGQVNILGELDEAFEGEPLSKSNGMFESYLARYSEADGHKTPTSRVAGMLRDCSEYLRNRRLVGTAGEKSGAKDES